MSHEPVTSLNPNVWYHVSERRVDSYSRPFKAMLQLGNDGGIFVFPTTADQYWQFQPLKKPGRYALRNSKTQMNKQLSVCRSLDEVDEAKTRPCMADPSGEDEQKWDVFDNGNKTLGLINVKNGTRFHLDVRPGTNAYMSSNINTKVWQPAQHWIYTSHKNIDDGAYSTTFTDVPTSTSARGSTRTRSATSGAKSSSGSADDDGSGSGLSTGAAAGIGIGAGLAVIALFFAACTLWRRRRRRRIAAGAALPSAGTDAEGAARSPEKTPVTPYSHGQSAPPQAPQEMAHTPALGELPADVHYELDASSR